MWTVEVYEAENGTVPYERFIGELNDLKFAALDAAVERVLVVRGLELARTEWLKALGGGLHEFRVRHQAGEITRMFGGDAPKAGARRQKVLLRVFVHFHGDRVVLTLGGYDKGDDPKERRQQREINDARKLVAEFKDRQRRDRRGRGR
jgi:hypothetical protein